MRIGPWRSFPHLVPDASPLGGLLLNSVLRDDSLFLQMSDLEADTPVSYPL